MTAPGRPKQTTIRGTLRVPGDKSTTHRGLLLAACAQGTSVLRGALCGADTISSAALASSLGAQVEWRGDEVRVKGCPEPLRSETVLDCGNSGTTARLAAGLLAGYSGRWTFTGDASLQRRPMGRVLQPLCALGAQVEGTGLPFTLHGAPLRGGEVIVDVPSAQVKSALLLAGLRCDRPLTVVQHTPTRDHTEIMLPLFGAHMDTEPGAVTVNPGALHGAEIDVFGDPSSAAFLVVAALLVPGSQLRLNHVGLWPRRTGFLRALAQAGAEIEVLARRGSCGDLLVHSRPLQGFEITPEDVPDLVDEVPVLALAAGVAQGTSRFAGLAELRLKESDRVAATAKMLQALGVEVELTADELTILGTDKLSGRADCDHDDHRLAMTAAIARLVSGDPLPDVVPSAAISWPGFLDTLRIVTAHA